MALLVTLRGGPSVQPTASIPKDDKVLTTGFLALLDGLQDVPSRHKKIGEMCALYGLDETIFKEKVAKYDAYMAEQAAIAAQKAKLARQKEVYDELNGRTAAEVIEVDDDGNCPGMELAQEAVELGMKFELVLKQGDKTKDPTVGQLIVFLSGVNIAKPAAPATAALLPNIPQNGTVQMPRQLIATRQKRRFQVLYQGEPLPLGAKLADVLRANFPDSVAVKLIDNPSELGYGPGTKFGAFQAVKKDPALADLFEQVEVQ